MTKSEYISNYIEKHKSKLKGLEYGLEYLNKLADLEEKAEKQFNKITPDKGFLKLPLEIPDL
jgi:hypothetical protein